jgi:transitional endoplasmic reticulum ATPase
VKETTGLTRGELETVCRLLPEGELNQDSIHQILNSMMISERPLQLRSSGESVAGYHSIMNELKLFVSVALGDETRRAMLPYSGLLLHGKSGNGKSLLIRKLSEEFEFPFFVLEFDRIFSKYLGDSEKAIRDVFASARFFAPSVVVIDDIDAIGAKRSDESGVGGRVLSTLLNEIDGVTENRQVLTMATTNALHIVDSALLRPGRFDRLIEILSPNAEERVEMFEMFRASTPVDPAVTSEYLGRMTDGFTCAEVRSFFRFAALQALFEEKEEVSPPYFERGLKRLRERRTASK